jgi:hypothetical protein
MQVINKLYKVHLAPIKWGFYKIVDIYITTANRVTN